MINAPNRRWFRFPLWAMLALVTLVAVGSWCYWDVWPRWEWRRQQAEFEQAAKQLAAGATMHDGLMWAAEAEVSGECHVTAGRLRTRGTKPAQYLAVEWPNAVYFVYWQFETAKRPSISVEVYRLSAAPKRYMVQTDAGRQAVRSRNKGDTIAEAGYRGDFVQFLDGDRGDDFGLEYELIHSHPGGN
jgi:hypothetical protein